MLFERKNESKFCGGVALGQLFACVTVYIRTCFSVHSSHLLTCTHLQTLLTHPRTHYALQTYTNTSHTPICTPPTCTPPQIGDALTMLGVRPDDAQRQRKQRVSTFSDGDCPKPQQICFRHPKQTHFRNSVISLDTADCAVTIGPPETVAGNGQIPRQKGVDCTNRPAHGCWGLCTSRSNSSRTVFSPRKSR